VLSASDRWVSLAAWRLTETHRLCLASGVALLAVAGSVRLAVWPVTWNVFVYLVFAVALLTVVGSVSFVAQAVTLRALVFLDSLVFWASFG
jgi:hypothetical protein